MDELIKILSEGIGLAIEAKAADDAAAEAQALANLDAKLAEVHPTVQAMKDQLAKDRAEVDQDLHEKFLPVTPPAAKADEPAVAPEEETKP